MSDDLTAKIQEHADAEHRRQPLCNDCGRPGEPYEYKGIHNDGLIAYKGDRLHPRCAEAREAVEGIDILVVDDRPTIPPYVYNTVRDRDLISIAMPYELRGIDGRDPIRRPRRTKRADYAQDRMAAAHAQAVEEQMLAAELRERADKQ